VVQLSQEIAEACDRLAMHRLVPSGNVELDPGSSKVFLTTCNCFNVILNQASVTLQDLCVRVMGDPRLLLGVKSLCAHTMRGEVSYAQLLALHYQKGGVFTYDELEDPHIQTSPKN
jgi:hypothetical protein